MDDIKLLDTNSRFSFSPTERMMERLSKSSVSPVIISWANDQLERGERPIDILEVLASGMVCMHAALAVQLIEESGIGWEDLAEIIAGDFKRTVDGMYAALFLQGKANEDQPHST